MTGLDIIGLMTGGVTIAGTLVGVTRYISQLQFQVRLERLEVAKEQAEKTRADLTAANKLLLDELTAARKVGAAASAKKAEIDEALSSLMKLMQAGAGSVYLPLMNETDRNPLGLVFVSIQPVTEQTMKLKKKIMPLQSLAGHCFRTAKAFTVANAPSSADHYGQADMVSGYKTQDTLNVPLRTKGHMVGVLQLLNKRDASFTESDIPRVEELSASLASTIDEFLRTPGYLEVLGFVPNRDTEDATVMFCDLTASSTLFQELNVSAALQHINDYLECICNVAFVHGATVDKYMGDGVLLRFNVPHSVDNHPIAAIKAALEIQHAFELVKKDWLIMGELLNEVHTRAGLAYGPVQRAVVGHPQYQSLTIFGTPVNAAINLCEISPRNRNTIVIDDMLYQHVRDIVDVKEIPGPNLGKAQRYIARAYEVQGSRRPL